MKTQVTVFGFEEEIMCTWLKEHWVSAWCIHQRIIRSGVLISCDVVTTGH